MVSTLIISYPNVIFKVVFDTTNDGNIGNHIFIGISILRIYRADILEKNIGKLKIVKNSWKYKENLIII